jgi:hypothetical protein
VFLNFPDQSHQKIFPWEHENVEIWRDLPHRITPYGSFCWGEIPQNTKRNKKRDFNWCQNIVISSSQQAWFAGRRSKNITKGVVDVTKNQIDTDEMCTCICMERVQDTHINNCSLSLSLITYLCIPHLEELGLGFD